MVATDRLAIFLGFRELRTVKFYKAVVCEFLATAILLLFICGASVTMENGKPLNLYTAAFNAGMAVAFIVWTFNHVSGAHINPALTLSLLATGHVSLTKTIAYTIAQCVGAVAGAALVWILVPAGWRGNLASTTFSQEITLAQGFAVETISTFTMILGIFATGDQLRTDHGGSYPLTIGFIIYMEVVWAGKLTGCSMNPARTLGPAVMAGTWDNHWVYWVAPSVGAVAAGLLYHHTLAESTKGEYVNIEEKPPATSPAPATQQLKFTDGTTVICDLKEGFENMALQIDKKV